ncbi:MAG: hypothetical protein KDD62_07025 [Bdellovibrionales bacterium]|nr:hypothetical protein [Bdellovibrionales bacterium]
MGLPFGTLILYGIWLLLPAFYFLLGLWCLLERYSKSPTKQNPEDFFKQGVFLAIAVAIAVALDQYVLGSLVAQYSPSFIPLGFYQILLLPLILIIGAKIFGGSEEVVLGRGLKPEEKKKHKGKRRR